MSYWKNFTVSINFIGTIILKLCKTSVFWYRKYQTEHKMSRSSDFVYYSSTLSTDFSVQFLRLILLVLWSASGTDFIVFDDLLILFRGGSKCPCLLRIVCSLLLSPVSFFSKINVYVCIYVSQWPLARHSLVSYIFTGRLRVVQLCSASAVLNGSVRWRRQHVGPT